MDNKQKCLCIFAILLAIIAYSTASSISASITNQTIGLNIVVNNTNLAPTIEPSVPGTGQRVSGTTYYNNNSDIEIFLYAHANATSQTSDIRLFINGTQVSSVSSKPVGSSPEENNKSIVAIIPRYASYKAIFANYHHYEWREYQILSGNITSNITSSSCSGCVNQTQLNEKVNITTNTTTSITAINNTGWFSQITLEPTFLNLKSGDGFSSELSMDQQNINFGFNAGNSLLLQETEITTYVPLRMNNQNITDINTINISNGIEMTNISISSDQFYVNYTMPAGITYPYQFEVNISNSTGVNNQTHIYFNGNSNANFSDIYAVQSNNLIPYCIMDNSSVFFNTTSNATLTLNYGNKNRTDSQNCAGTFNQYEGIHSTAFYGNWNITKLPQIVEANVKTTASNADIRWGVTNATLLTTYKTYCAIETDVGTAKRYLQCYANGSSVAAQNEAPQFTNNTLYRLRIDVSPTSVIAYANNDPIGVSTSTTALSQKVGLLMYFSAGTGYQSWSFMRNYISSEPDRNTWGSQTINSTSTFTLTTRWCLKVDGSGNLYTTSGNC